MIRLALKNLWARKRRNGWLMAELIVVSVILWHFADPVTVQTYVNMLPDGFDSENLYRISIQEYEPSSHRYQEKAAEIEVRRENMWRIRDRVRNYPGVESATFQIGEGGPGGRSFSMSGLGIPVSEDIHVSHFYVDFVPKSDYFTTFRYQTAGGPSTEQMDRMILQDREQIITEGAFPEGHSWGRTYKPATYEYKIVASVRPVKMFLNKPPQLVQFVGADAQNAGAIIFRLREDVDPDAFLTDFREWALRELQLGNYFVVQIESYDHYIRQGVFSNTYDYEVQLLLGSFFLFCIFFGVSGSFWMQMRARREEIGILKSFGATSGKMVRLFLLEGLILTTVSVFLGAVIYLQYALHTGLYLPEMKYCSPFMHYWFESFKLHYLIVSAVVWLLMVLIVSFGIYVPVRGISRIAPTEALHEE